MSRRTGTDRPLSVNRTALHDSRCGGQTAACRVNGSAPGCPPMTPFERKLSVRTRDPAFLVRATILILAVFALSAAMITRMRPASGDDSEAAGIVELLTAELPDDDSAVLQWARMIALADSDPGTAEPVSGERQSIHWLSALKRVSMLPEARRTMVEEYFRAMRRDAEPTAIQAVLDRSRQSPPAAVPLTMAGDVLRFHGSYVEALRSYEDAAAAGTGTDARQQALRLCQARGWKEEANRLLTDPVWRSALDAADYRTQHDVSLLTGDWTRLIRLNAYGLLHVDDDPDLLFLTLLSGCIWFICIHKGLGIAGRNWWMGGLALILGIASTALTLLILSLQKGSDVWLQTGGQNAWQALLEHLAGTGLREETAKLLLFAPLLPLLRRGTEARAMAAASCTGLGFAIEENLGYFSETDGAIVWARFLTANFLHLSLTGLTGLALFRMVRWPQRFAAEFAVVFLTAVVAHGLWNYSLTATTPGVEPETRDIQFIVALGLACFYFQTMRQCRDSGRNIISPHGFFVLGTAVMLGVILNFSVWHHGGADGTGLVIAPALASFAQAAVFFWMLRDS